MVICLSLCAVLTALGLLSLPAAAVPAIPMRTDGRAFDQAGFPLPIGTAIRTFVDGVDYSNRSAVLDDQGSFSVLTLGNNLGENSTSETPTIKEGADVGDEVIYAASDLTTTAGIFNETHEWSSETTVTMDFHLGSSTSTPQPIKIQGLVTRPARGGSPFVLLCNPGSVPVSLADYYLETDRPGTYHGASMMLTGTVGSMSTVQVNLSAPLTLIPTGDAAKLVYRNPDGSGASAGGLDVVVDRVEFNATQGGTLSWEPGNTIMADAPAPGVGQILERETSCTDTNRPQDFSLNREPGLPANGNPGVSISVPAAGQTVAAANAATFVWTMSNDIFATAYLHVWANVTIGSQTTALLVDAVGVSSVTWMTPDLAFSGAVFRVDVVDPFGERASDSRTFDLSRQSAIALLVAVLVAVVLALFLLFGYLRTRKAERAPPAAPPSVPPPPQTVPPASVAVETAADATKKVCPRCHTTVNAVDVTCFYCGYRFPGETPPP